MSFASVYRDFRMRRLSSMVNLDTAPGFLKRKA
jgi:hypothetical protein